MRRLAWAVVAVLVSVLAPGQPALAQDSSIRQAQTSAGNAIGVGVEVGEPAGLTGKYVLPGASLGLAAGIGRGVFKGAGLQLHGELEWTFLRFGGPANDSVALFAGAGVRYVRHTYAPSSLDELGFDKHIGLRATLGGAFHFSTLPIEVFAEAAPGVDLHKSVSCTLFSGVDSVCPHDRENPMFFQLVAGARYYFAL